MHAVLKMPPLALPSEISKNRVGGTRVSTDFVNLSNTPKRKEAGMVNENPLIKNARKMQGMVNLGWGLRIKKRKLEAVLRWVTKGMKRRPAGAFVFAQSFISALGPLKPGLSMAGWQNKKTIVTAQLLIVYS